MQLPIIIPQDVDAEWLMTNGTGGYGAGAVDGRAWRRHDGWLVAALDHPHGRTVMVDDVREIVHLDGGAHILDPALGRFRLVAGLPVWTFSLPDGQELERRLVPRHGHNIHYVLYRLSTPKAVRLTLIPWFHVRHADGALDQPVVLPTVAARTEGAELDFPAWAVLRLAGGTWRDAPVQCQERVYAIETGRGYHDRGQVHALGEMDLLFQDGQASLVLSTESWDVTMEWSPLVALEQELARRRALLEGVAPALRQGQAANAVLSADAFIFTPRNRPELALRMERDGKRLTSVVAGYPWFNDWGRDTMISLEGLCLVTNRPQDARNILATFAAYIQDGLIPDNVPDGPWPPVYHSADASLWFFHAVDRYLRHCPDDPMRPQLIDALCGMLDHHLRGTRFNIRMDPADGLLSQGQDGVQLTWMDAICDGWVVTPRRGKAVEINALWYNALMVVAHWADQGAVARDLAQRTRRSFNARFWWPQEGCLLDVVDGDGAESALVRPNQIFALSLPHAVLEQDKWDSVLTVIRDRLLCEQGLKSLAPGSVGYRSNFGGNQLSRDGAYHQGTVWPWLMGAFMDAWVKVWPDRRDEARQILERLASQMTRSGLGFISEVFDADSPRRDGGCPAQAWNMAEWLRAWALCCEGMDMVR